LGNASPRIDDLAAAALSEKEILDSLALQENDDEETVALLESLGRFGRSHDAVKALICWLEYQYWGRNHQFWHNASENLLPPQPAAKALKRIGVFAVPQLVEEYVLFFENTSLAARNGRYSLLDVDANSNVLPVQSPRHRLSSIRLVLYHTPEMFACTVECAWNLMQANPDDDRIQRACRRLCKILEQYQREERKALFQSFTRSVDGSMLTPDRFAVAALLDISLEDDERAGRIAKLTQFKNSPIVISELVHWLEFKPNLKSTPKPGPDEKQRGHEEYPSAVALAQFGPAAATQLVGDYLYYFENTAIDDNRKRMFRREEKDEKGRELEVQDPSPRLKLIVTVLSLTPETAQKAVKFALKRSDEQPDNARIQRGCRKLIGDIVSQFPKAERAELFPRSALER